MGYLEGEPTPEASLARYLFHAQSVLPLPRESARMKTTRCAPSILYQIVSPNKPLFFVTYSVFDAKSHREHTKRGNLLRH